MGKRVGSQKNKKYLDMFRSSITAIGRGDDSK